MKTTIEIKGYQIVIDETEELVTVTAMKDDETVEEFSLELNESEEDQGKEAQGGKGIKSFDDFDGEEEDFDDDSMDEESMDDDETQNEDDNETQDEKDGRALESFQSFINKNK